MDTIEPQHPSSRDGSKEERKVIYPSMFFKFLRKRRSRHLLLSLRLDDSVHCLSLSPDGKLLVIGTRTYMWIFQCFNEALLGPIGVSRLTDFLPNGPNAHNEDSVSDDVINSIDWSNSAKWLAVCSKNGGIYIFQRPSQIWDGREANEQSCQVMHPLMISENTSLQIVGCIFNITETICACYTKDASIAFYDFEEAKSLIETGDELEKGDGEIPTAVPLKSITVLEEHTAAVTGALFIPVSFRVCLNTRLPGFNGTEDCTQNPHENFVSVSLLISRSRDSSIRIWSIKKYTVIVTDESDGSKTRKTSTKYECSLELNHTSSVTCMVLHPELLSTKTEQFIDLSEHHSSYNVRLLSSSRDGTVRLWEILVKQNGNREPDQLSITGDCVREFIGHTSDVLCCDWSPFDNARYAVSGSFDNSVRIWDLSTGRCRAMYTGHSRAVTIVKFVPNSKNGVVFISSSWDGTCSFWVYSPNSEDPPDSAEFICSLSVPRNYGSGWIRLMSIHPSVLGTLFMTASEQGRGPASIHSRYNLRLWANPVHPTTLFNTCLRYIHNYIREFVIKNPKYQVVGVTPHTKKIIDPDGPGYFGLGLGWQWLSLPQWLLSAVFAEFQFDPSSIGRTELPPNLFLS